MNDAQHSAAANGNFYKSVQSMQSIVLAITIGVLPVLSLALSVVQSSSVATANVTGYARSFVTAHRIAGAVITASGDGRHAALNTTTDSEGRFRFQWPVGHRVELTITAEGYYPTTGAALVVPSNGFSGPHNEYTFQTPRMLTYEALKAVVIHWQHGQIDPSCCHVVTTVCAENKTLDDDPQGEPGATIELDPPPTVKVPPFYFGIIDGKTNPFSRGLLNTSADGGAAWFNVPVREQPYTLLARKDGVIFSNTSFYCRANRLVNIAPPQGPSVIRRLKSL